MSCAPANKTLSPRHAHRRMPRQCKPAWAWPSRLPRYGLSERNPRMGGGGRPGAARPYFFCFFLFFFFSVSGFWLGVSKGGKGPLGGPMSACGYLPPWPWPPRPLPLCSGPSPCGGHFSWLGPFAESAPSPQTTRLLHPAIAGLGPHQRSGPMPAEIMLVGPPPDQWTADPLSVPSHNPAAVDHANLANLARLSPLAATEEQDRPALGAAAPNFRADNIPDVADPAREAILWAWRAIKGASVRLNETEEQMRPV